MATPTGLTVDASTLAGSAPFEASVTASAVDPDLGPVTIQVDWGDGTVGTGESGEPITHTYTNPSLYPVAVTAVDGSDNRTAPTVLLATVNLALGLDHLDSEIGYCGDTWFNEIPCDTGDNPDLAELCIVAAIRFIVDSTCSNYIGECSATIRPPATLSGRCSATGRGRAGAKYDLTQSVPSPIREIAAVYVNGELVDPKWYRLANRRWLVPQSPSSADDDNPLDPWPLQDMSLPLGDTDTWWVEVVYGRIVPPPLVLAAKRLACEMFKALNGQPCGFPDGASAVSQAGITISFQPRQPKKTGIPYVDAQIEKYGCDSAKTVRRIVDPAAGRPEVAFG